MLGTKINMSQTFVGTTRVPVTVVKTGPCVVTQIKTEEKDGYSAIQIGFATRPTKNISNALKGHLKTAKDSKTAVRFLGEVEFLEGNELKVGDKIELTDVFSVGDTVAVTGTSKGKGFAGVMKRWHFHGGPKTHGQSDRHRAPGSIGQGTTPGRVFKGKHMAGRMGSDTVTVKNLKIVNIDSEKNELQVSGPVPGRPGGLLIIKRISEKQTDSASSAE